MGKRRWHWMKPLCPLLCAAALAEPVPDVWGPRQRFASSGMDGPTSWARPLVGCTRDGEKGGRGVLFRTVDDFGPEWNPNAPGFLWIAEGARFEDELVATDLIVTTAHFPDGARARLTAVFADAATVWLEAAAERGEPTVGVALTGGPEETLPLVLSGPGGTIRLRRGESVRWALAEGPRPVPGAKELERACEARWAFFRALPQPPAGDVLLAKTWYKAASVLKSNCCTPEGQIRLPWTTPDRWPHRHMWLWDSCFHAMGLAVFSPEWARNAVLAVLHKQREDGFIPHRMQPDGGDSRIPMSPLLAWTCWDLYECGAADRAFLEEAYPLLARYLEWYTANTRGIAGLHTAPDDATGMDNSPRFDSGELGACVDFSAFLAQEQECLARIAGELGLPVEAASWRARGEALAATVNERMWDPAVGFYFDLDREGRRIPLKTVAGFVPLLAGVATRQQASRLVDHLVATDEFWTPVPVATVSKDEPAYGDDMWRGPVWINYNYMIVRGLERYGYAGPARRLAEATVREVARWYGETGVLWEFYDAEGRTHPLRLHRKGLRERNIADYGWTASLYLRLLRDRGGRLTGEGAGL